MVADVQERGDGISIHAPRTGSDGVIGVPCAAAVDFNPRSPHGERQDETRHAATSGNFNPRSPHGERRSFPTPGLSDAGISIHAPRTGSDTVLVTDKTLALEFQSTLPARGATRWPRRWVCSRSISIHAPRTGSDGFQWLSSSHPPISIHAPRTGSDTRRRSRMARINHFNPRSPHGERQALLSK